MASSSAAPPPSRSPSPTPPILPLPAPPSSSSRRPPPPCWTHEETLALIESYRDKWLSLRRTGLRAPHWQEIADAVAARCPSSPVPKTPIQCRHKVEKLRKRLRSERRRSLSLRPGYPPTSSWPYFSLLDSLDPLPTPAPPSSSSGDDDERPVANGGGITGIRFTIPKALRSKTVGSREAREEMRRRMERKRRRRREGDVWGEMASALMKLGDGFLRVEQMKLEMTKEMERRKMEMQLRRTEVMLDAQRQIMDALVKGLMGQRTEACTDS